MKAGAALSVLSVVLTLACNKGPAEEAIALAEQEIAAARPELEAYAPAELAGLDAAVREARARASQGQYTEALRGAQEIPARVRAALGVARRQKDEQVAVWWGLAQSVPRLEGTIATRVAWLAEAQRLPPGMDEAGFAAVPAELESMRRAWVKASAAFDAGDVATAVRTGQEVRRRAEVLATRVGLVFSALPAPAQPTASPSPTPSATPSPAPSPPPASR